VLRQVSNPNGPEAAVIDLAVAAVVKDLQSKSKKVTSSSEVAQVGNDFRKNGDAGKKVGRLIAEAMEKSRQRGASSRSRKQKVS